MARGDSEFSFPTNFYDILFPSKFKLICINLYIFG